MRYPGNEYQSSWRSEGVGRGHAGRGLSTRAWAWALARLVVLLCLARLESRLC